MFALFKRGHDEEKTESGIWVAVSKYQMRNFVEFYGLAWTVAEWGQPCTRGQWIAQFGTEVPWPREGMYFPMEYVMRAIDLIPDDAASEVAVRALKRHKAKTVEQHVEEAEAVPNAMKASKRAEWQDFVHDARPAFDNNPGGKGSTSFRQTAIN